MTNIIKNNGFSLLELELMITLIILGIIVSIAIPNYNSYLTRQNRALVKHNLKLIALSLESYKGLNKSFEKANLKELGFSDIDDKENKYIISNLTNSNFLVKGISKNDSSCATMSLNAMNQRVALSIRGEDTKSVCWQ
jgi:type IV pilus assembly protein PilE